ncbi:Zn-dependent hydrolase [Rhizobium sp. BK251]|uniref:Zn-dependent hydrolase n=1 Tax=Rhizobium sp. BK251 TaxID=2512125 RepID=UPI001050BC9B|nr:Zn-dependent hydrolase [Rhizobium sp. BK251]TCL75749.1 N-carbamoyl-L-amino-acid hydrolase [Rhizobium sp. BK251]
MVRIDGARLNSRLEQFAAIGATARGGVNRQALTEGDREARRLLAELALSRGFAVFQDPMANLFIRRDGSRSDLPPLLIGSHLDSQPAGGRFDGALGTLSAFEVLESLEDSNLETMHPVEVVAWTNEEGCRFSPGCMGSMAFAAGSIPADWAGKRSADGSLFADELSATLESLPQAAMRPLGFAVAAYVEVHIEQGPSLEAEDIPIGVVTGIQGTRWLEVTVSGQTAHAGTTSLAYRRDPLRALTAALGRLYDAVMPVDADARFTIGRISVEPGSINAIPETARCSVDIRHPDPARLDAIERQVIETVSQASGRQRCVATVSRLFDMPPGRFAPEIVATIESAATELGLKSKRMLSGAFHDALFVSRIAPSAMIFVPCRDGLSHNEAEYVEPDHAAAGCRLLAAVTMSLASRS